MIYSVANKVKNQAYAILFLIRNLKVQYHLLISLMLPTHFGSLYFSYIYTFFFFLNLPNLFIQTKKCLFVLITEGFLTLFQSFKFYSTFSRYINVLPIKWSTRQEYTLGGSPAGFLTGFTFTAEKYLKKKTPTTPQRNSSFV